LTPGTRAAAGYLTPALAIVAVTMVSQVFTAGFDWLYPLRVLAAGGLLLYFWRGQDSSVLRGTWSWWAVALGVLVFVLWLALEPRAPTTRMAASLGTDLARLPSHWAAIWLAFRVIGSVITVSLAEELVFRGSLSRRLIASDFERVPLGRFTWTSCLISSVLFGAVHGRWLAGTIAGLVFARALSRRGELTDAVLAHATANALLAAYVLTTGTWSLWS